jgi:hypothetical protein
LIAARRSSRRVQRKTEWPTRVTAIGHSPHDQLNS